MSLHTLHRSTGSKVLMRDVKHNASSVQAVVVYFKPCCSLSEASTEAVRSMNGLAPEHLHIVSVCLAETDECVRL